MKVKDLNPAEYNPRKMTDKKLEMLGKAMTEFGGLSGIVFNRRTGRLVGGHQRIKHLDPGWEIEKRPLEDPTGTVAVGFVMAPDGKWTYREVDWPEDKEITANIAANKHGGEFILSDLRELLHGLNDGFMDTDLTGFDVDELTEIFGNSYKKGRIGDDDVPNVSEKTAKLGDVFSLDKHRLICGDIRSPEVLDNLMAGRNAEMVFTDPPYNVNYESPNEKSYLGGSKRILNDNLGEEFEQFLFDTCESILSLCEGSIYICMSSAEIHTLRKAFIRAGGHWSTFIIWAKNTFTIGRSDYQRQYEPILYGWKEGGKHFWCGSRDQGDVWEFPKPQKNKLHPTMKPVELCMRGIVNSSQPNGIVLDAFLGSGSTLIACEKTERICYGVELDPHFCDVIVKRWEEFTGKRAQKL